MLKTEKIKLEEEYKKSPGSFDISFEKLLDQLEIFEKGVPYIKLVKPAVIDDGILRLTEAEEVYFREIGETEIAKGRVTKFVPASGAASRMFKRQQSCMVNFKNLTLDELKLKAENGDQDCLATCETVLNIKRFAFEKELSGYLINNGINNPGWKEIIHYLVDNNGLGYADKPKGCILFHKYPEGPRTAFEEHFVEGFNYAKSVDGFVRIHFTISPEHENLFNEIKERYLISHFAKESHFDISYSFQKKTTNTIAVTLENKIFRDKNGKPVFRPGGHGALLENLTDLNGDIILIKNIDNVAHEHLNTGTYKFKKILTGILSQIQQQIFGYLKQMEADVTPEEKINEIILFIETRLFHKPGNNFNKLESSEKKNRLFELLNRPLRVCGMVKNQGEPGGGPFWTMNKDGSISLQVVESVQTDLSDANQNKIFYSSTHFSPVDFACGVKNYKGENFNLSDFSDPETSLITNKSKDGKELKALELPGLWNGGMAEWNTIFVEVPLITFNPVKEVNDLLKPEHQP